ncbi:MAG: class I SAM-dependent methyltransferase [Candidatus Obscuribacter sp.]|nr:class I SAM-dependent methyltransferase [Candidatus Obscuribacter sp.]
MDLETARFVLSKSGEDCLKELTARYPSIAAPQELSIIEWLRKRANLNQAQSSAILEVAKARQKAAETNKFSRAVEMFFTREALEQASGEEIAAHRSRRFARAFEANATIADLCCGIGGDTTALSRNFSVTGVDLDQARLLFAAANAAVYGNAERFAGLHEDVTKCKINSYQGAFFDPGRRTKDGRRINNPEHYLPPLGTIHSWLPHLKGLAVKLSPGIDYEKLKDLDCEIEIISQDGEVKEALLWFGALREAGGKAARHRATLLTSNKYQAPTRQEVDMVPGDNYRPGFDSNSAQGDSKKQIITLSDAGGMEPLAVAPLARYLHEPDGAIIRAGLVELVGARFNALKIDQDIAYLTGATPATAPLMRSFEVLAAMPFSLKKLKAELQALACTSVVVKKRGSPIAPEELLKALALKNAHKKAKHDAEPQTELTVFLTHLDGIHSAIITREYKA